MSGESQSWIREQGLRWFGAALLVALPGAAAAWVAFVHVPSVSATISPQESMVARDAARYPGEVIARGRFGDGAELAVLNNGRALIARESEVQDVPSEIISATGVRPLIVETEGGGLAMAWSRAGETTNVSWFDPSGESARRIDLWDAVADPAKEAPSQITALAAGPGGDLVLGASDGRVLLARYQEISDLSSSGVQVIVTEFPNRHAVWIRHVSVSVSADGQLKIASFSADGSVKQHAVAADSQIALLDERQDERFKLHDVPEADLTNRISLYEAAQIELIRIGLLSGEPNGDWGAESLEAMRRFQTAMELPTTGLVDEGALALLTSADEKDFQDPSPAPFPSTDSIYVVDGKLIDPLPEKYAHMFLPPGELAPGSGEGLADRTVYAPGIRFPIERTPAFVNSQVWGAGGFRGPGGGQCSLVNYSYPWRDNFCETRPYSSELCSTGKGTQGIQIRPEACMKSKYWAVAAETGRIAKLGTYTVTLVGESGREYRYMHMDMRRLKVTTGSRVKRGDRIGLVSNDFGGTATTIHLNFSIRQVMRDSNGRLIRVFVPPYASLIDAYLRLLDEEALDSGDTIGGGADK